VALHIVAARPSQDLLALPWTEPLEQWDESVQVPIARGISRHVVRFVRVEGRVLAVKETRESWAVREYHMLRNLRRLGLPAVEPVGIVTGRTSRSGEDIEPVLLTLLLAHSPALPRAVQPAAAARHRAAGRGCARGASGQAARGRILVG
jgi:hypothetical protein